MVTWTCPLCLLGIVYVSTPWSLWVSMGWNNLVGQWGWGDRAFFVFGATVTHAITTWLPSLLFWGADKFQWWRRYKLPRERPDMQPGLAANVTRDQTAFKEFVIGTLLIVPVMMLGAFPIVSWRGMAITGPLPPATECIAHLVGMLVCCDTMFYWVHRACHHPRLYKHVHKQHHEYKATNVWATEYFSPPDFAANLLPGVVPGVVFGSHFAVLMAFTAARSWQSVQSHAGYDLPYDPCNRGLFLGGAKRHDYHHSHNQGCYGDWTPFWDWVCGTDRKYAAFWRKRDASLREGGAAGSRGDEGSGLVGKGGRTSRSQRRHFCQAPS